MSHLSDHGPRSLLVAAAPQSCCRPRARTEAHRHNPTHASVQHTPWWTSQRRRGESRHVVVLSVPSCPAQFSDLPSDCYQHVIGRFFLFFSGIMISGMLTPFRGLTAHLQLVLTCVKINANEWLNMMEEFIVASLGVESSVGWTWCSSWTTRRRTRRKKRSSGTRPRTKNASIRESPSRGSSGVDVQIPRRREAPQQAQPAHTFICFTRGSAIHSLTTTAQQRFW